MPSIHPLSDVHSPHIGRGTRLWQFSVIHESAPIGVDCNIASHVFIENDVIIGDRFTVKCGVQIWDGIRISDDVFIVPNVAFTNHPFPRSQKPVAEYPVATVGKGASIGASATILPGITIDPGAMIGAGAVVTRDVPENAIVRGNPAVISGYARTRQATAMTQFNLNACRIIDLPKITDARGSLTFVEGGRHIPFDIKRTYYLYDVPGGAARGGHAHRDLHQLIIAISGAFDIVLDDGKKRNATISTVPTSVSMSAR